MTERLTETGYSPGFAVARGLGVVEESFRIFLLSESIAKRLSRLLVIEEMAAIAGQS
jgi:hypothetical protein